MATLDETDSQTMSELLAKLGIEGEVSFTGRSQNFDKAKKEV